MKNNLEPSPVPQLDWLANTTEPVPLMPAESRPLPWVVLIVDDDVTIVCTIEVLLRTAGFETASADDVASAYREIRDKQPDLIILDVNLPDGSGFDVIRTLHQQAPDLTPPILFISANDDMKTRIAGLELGAVDYITKPIVGAEIIARVRTQLRLQQAYRHLAELQTERVQLLSMAQQSMMPRAEDLPEALFEVSIHQVYAAGGDFYDVLPIETGVVDYLVADASGHDLAASLWTAILKALASEYAGRLNDTLDIVQAINAALCRLLPSQAFFTLVYARINHLTGHLSLVNAGHPPAILVPKAGSASSVLYQEGDVVGAFPDASFGVIDRTLAAGDRLFLYTDGLIEARGDYQQGLAQLALHCGAHRTLSLREQVATVVSAQLAGLTPCDDTLFLGVER